MTSTSSSPTSPPPRYATPRRADRATIGGRVARIAAALGTPFMPWQQQVADVAGEIDPATGLLVYREVIVTVMRQQGKTTLQLPVMVDRCLSWPTPQHVTYAAQNGVAARQKFMDEHIPLLLKSPLAKGARVRRTSGHEALLWRNGSRHTLTAAKETSGHGTTLDGAVIDEAFAYQDARLEQAFIPAMQTRSEPQLLITSTAGYAPDLSPYLWGKVERGRARAEAGETDSVAYFEWSFSDDDDPFDPATWHRRMPALGHTVGEGAVKAAAASMDEREFIRAFGNRWQADTFNTVFDINVWTSLANRSARLTDPVAFAIDTAPDRSYSSITAADADIVEVVDHRPGTGWVVDRAIELDAKWRPVAWVIDPGSAAGSLLPELAAANIDVETPTARDVAAAWGAFHDAVVDKSVGHLGQASLNAAVTGARTRPLGDAYALARRISTTDISPLVSATLARWVWQLRHDDGDIAANIH